MRTARLVALAVARRTTLGADVQDEVRLAVGEACTRAVHRATSSADPPGRMRIRLTDGPDWLEVEVADLPAADPHGTTVAPRTPLDGDVRVADGPGPRTAGPGELDEDDEVSLRLLHGLAPFVEVSAGVVRLVWHGASVTHPG